MAGDKPQLYAAIITRNSQREYWAVDVAPDIVDPSSATSRSSANLSIPKEDPITLGIYSVNPCDIINLLKQSERGTIAWRVWEEPRRLPNIATDFRDGYDGQKIEIHTGGPGDYALITFKESSLTDLLGCSLFKAEQVEE